MRADQIARPRATIDVAIDLASIFGRFDEKRRLIWEGLVAGQTLREIGTELGLSHQQVHRRKLEIMNQVARYFGNVEMMSRYMICEESLPARDW